MSIRVRVLQANHGDCILVTHEDTNGVFNLLVDGGNSATFTRGASARRPGPLRFVLDELKEKKQNIDLAILTHIDDDHIGGLLKAFKSKGYLSDMVKSIWFNSSRLITEHFLVSDIPENSIRLGLESPETSVQQGRTLEALLGEIGCHRAPLVIAGQTIKIGPFEFDILSPTEEALKRLLCIWPKEKSSPDTSAATDYHLSFEAILAGDEFLCDKSISNGSSIAFILRAGSTTMLFLGDAHDDVVVSELKRLGYSAERKLAVDLVKLSHHGSQHNTSRDFLDVVECKRFIVSSNGAIHGLPDKRTIARILAATDSAIYFNYKKIIPEMCLPHENGLYSGRLLELAEELVFE